MCGTFSEGTVLRKCCPKVRRISWPQTIRPASSFQARPVTRQVKDTFLSGQLQPGLVLFLDSGTHAHQSSSSQLCLPLTWEKFFLWCQCLHSTPDQPIQNPWKNLYCLSVPHSQNCEPWPSQLLGIAVSITQCLSQKSPSVCIWLWGHMVTRWRCPRDQLIIPEEVILLTEEQAGPCHYVTWVSCYWKLWKCLWTHPNEVF